MTKLLTSFYVCHLLSNSAQSINDTSSSPYTVISRSRQGTGYITAAFTVNDVGYKHVCSRFLKSSANARLTAIQARSNSPGGYTISKNLRLRPFILPTPVILESSTGDETSTYVGTSSNVASLVTLVSVNQDNILGSVLMLFDATDSALLPKGFTMGVAFNKKTTKAKKLDKFLKKDLEYVIGALPCYMPIPCGHAITVKGKIEEAHHDHMRGLNSFAQGWLTCMLGNGPGNIPFDLEFQKAAFAASSTLGSIIPKVPKGMTFVDSPHFDLDIVSPDAEEDDDNMAAGIQALKAEATEALLRLNPPPQTIPLTPAGSLPPRDIDFEDPITSEQTCPKAMRLKRNLGKLRLFTMGYTKDDGAKLLQLRPEIIKLFSLSTKDMTESFSNQLQATSEEQGNSLDCINRQTSLPDWSMTP